MKFLNVWFQNCSVQPRTKRSMSPTDGKEERAAVVSAGPLLVHTRTQPSHCEFGDSGRCLSLSVVVCQLSVTLSTLRTELTKQYHTTLSPQGQNAWTWSGSWLEPLDFWPPLFWRSARPKPSWLTTNGCSCSNVCDVSTCSRLCTSTEYCSSTLTPEFFSLKFTVNLSVSSSWRPDVYCRVIGRCTLCFGCTSWVLWCVFYALGILLFHTYKKNPILVSGCGMKKWKTMVKKKKTITLS